MANETNRLTWSERSRRKLLECYAFDVYEVVSESESGQKGAFSLLETGDWANIVPVCTTDDGEAFVMVRQHRHGARRTMLEFPGGMVDAGETPGESAARELLEETGYRAGALELIGRTNPNPALMNNLCHTFVAYDLELVREQSLDALELLDVEVISVEEAERQLVSLANSNALMLTALYWYLKWKERRRH
jgi:ADP-ribose pyrophosphatase